MAIPTTWRTDLPGDAVSGLNWWLACGDPGLAALIESACLKNLGVAAAEQPVAQARAELEDADRARLDSSQRAYELSRIRYEAGSIDAVTLLLAQTTLLRARDGLIRSRSSYLQALAGAEAAPMGLPQILA